MTAHRDRPGPVDRLRAWYERWADPETAVVPPPLPSPWSDGVFSAGTNLPWLSYGNDAGENAWHPTGGIGQPGPRARFREALARIADAGGSLVRWFVLCDGRSGLREDPDGTLRGLDAAVFHDVDAAIDEFDRAGLLAILVLLDFHWFSPGRTIGGVRVGGRTRLVTTPAGRERLMDLVLAPLFDRYGRATAVAAWDIVNEPEWVVGAAWPLRHRDALSRASLRSFVTAITADVHARTKHAATVGLASAGGLDLVRGVGLDVYQLHWYDASEMRAPLDRPVADLGLDRPVFLGEFPTRGSRLPPAAIVETARRNGYAAALAWSAPGVGTDCLTFPSPPAPAFGTPVAHSVRR